MKNSQPSLQAHCQNRTSPCTNQSFVKELAKPTQKKNCFKKFPDPFKKYKTQTYKSTQTDKEAT